jgi:predicted SprT family Zn-dependent metalloprotease
MNAAVATSLARQLMDQHGLQAWSFRFDAALKRFGVCRYRSKEIGLSRELVTRNEASRVRNTILHEIAHALVGPGHGHGRAWKRKAIEIGAEPRRCYPESVNAVPGKYVYICQRCWRESHYHRKLTLERSCGVCCPGRFNPAYLMVPREQVMTRGPQSVTPLQLTFTDQQQMTVTIYT